MRKEISLSNDLLDKIMIHQKGDETLEEVLLRLTQRSKVDNQISIEEKSDNFKDEKESHPPVLTSCPFDSILDADRRARRTWQV